LVHITYELYFKNLVKIVSDRTLFIFQDMAKKVLGDARYAKYLQWIENADEARQGRLGEHSFEKANQYDKAEELLTWNTFAPLLGMDKSVRDRAVVMILEAALETDMKRYVDEKGFSVEFEKEIPSPKGYLKRIRETVQNHPVKYIRESAKDKEVLEGDTHVDLAIENSRLLILVEVKFTSDISCQVRYDPIRNQLARLIDVGIESARNRKLVVLVISPKWAYDSKSRLYCYKLNEYRRAAENIQADIPHRGLDEIQQVLVGIGWVSLKDAASIIFSKTEMDTVKRDLVRQFYEERKINLRI
jgi:hypothetical protein